MSGHAHRFDLRHHGIEVKLRGLLLSIWCRVLSLHPEPAQEAWNLISELTRFGLPFKGFPSSEGVRAREVLEATALSRSASISAILDVDRAKATFKSGKVKWCLRAELVRGFAMIVFAPTLQTIKLSKFSKRCRDHLKFASSA